MTITFPVLEVLSAAAICTSQSALISCSRIPGTFTKYVNSFFSSSVSDFSLGTMSDRFLLSFGWIESINCSSSSSSERDSEDSSSSSSSSKSKFSSSESSGSSSASSVSTTSSAAGGISSSSSSPMLSLRSLAINSSSDMESSEGSSFSLCPAGPFINSSSAAWRSSSERNSSSSSSTTGFFCSGSGSISSSSSVITSSSSGISSAFSSFTAFWGFVDISWAASTISLFSSWTFSSSTFSSGISIPCAEAAARIVSSRLKFEKSNAGFSSFIFSAASASSLKRLFCTGALGTSISSGTIFFIESGIFSVGIFRFSTGVSVSVENAFFSSADSERSAFSKPSVFSSETASADSSAVSSAVLTDSSATFSLVFSTFTLPVSGSSSGTLSYSFSEAGSRSISSWTSFVCSVETMLSSISSILRLPKMSRSPLEILSWRLSTPSRSSLLIWILSIDSLPWFSAFSAFSSSLMVSASSGFRSFGTNCCSYRSFSAPVRAPIRCFRSIAFIT